jgi:predicted aspartyl protease
MRIFLLLTTIIIMLNTASMARASDFDSPIPLFQTGSKTFYVKGKMSGDMSTNFMVDTGSGYVTINKKTLLMYKSKGQAKYTRKLLAVMADGSEKEVSVYMLSSLQLSGGCVIRDVEAAVFPGADRNILGLSALLKVAPFAFNVSNSTLLLTNCNATS